MIYMVVGVAYTAGISYMNGKIAAPRLDHAEILHGVSLGTVRSMPKTVVVIG